MKLTRYITTDDYTLFLNEKITLEQLATRWKETTPEVVKITIDVYDIERI